MFEDEEIWEEPEHLLEPEQLYGSDKMYDNSQSFQVYSRPEHKSAFGLNLRDGRLAKAGKLLLEGNSIGYVSKRVGINRQSIRKLYFVVIAQNYQNGNSEILCECCKKPDHSGQCLFRKKKYNGSPEIAIRFGKMYARNTKVEIMDCGCFVDKICRAILIECESNDCEYK